MVYNMVLKSSDRKVICYKAESNCGCLVWHNITLFAYQLFTDKEIIKYKIPARLLKRVEISRKAIKTICGIRYPDTIKLRVRLTDL